MLGIFKFVLIVTSPILFLIFVLILLVFGHYYYLRSIKGLEPIPKERNPEDFFYKPDTGFLKKLFWSFPKRFAEDKITLDPNHFKPHSVHLFVGKQGTGKTIAMCHSIMMMMNKYPKAKTYTNMAFKYQTDELGHWKQLVDIDNGTDGAILALDEIHTWFSSNDSKNFPPEMLQTITQQRKKRKIILGTVQVYSRASKQIRENTYKVHVCKTYFSCITRVRTTYPEYWNDDKQKFTQFERSYWFVHDDVLRNCYDTYRVIEKYKEVGFKDEIKISD